MKNHFVIIFFLFLISCENSKEKEDYVYLINKDSLDSKSSPSFIDNIKADTSIFFHDDSTAHNSIIIDSIRYYVVEGDLLLDEYDYMQYKIWSTMSKGSSRGREKIVMDIIDNKIVKWANGYTLKYCISRNSFKDQTSYNIVKENIKKATSEWERTCDIKFYHDERLDRRDFIKPSAGLTFVVLGYNSNSEFIASAFFPNDPASKRRLLIDPSYFTTRFDKVGVLRHELGHVIGLRHEQIKKEAPRVCRGESSAGTINITGYDPKSVMHYFCGGMGTLTLEITDIDRRGIQQVYGPPKAN